MPLEYETQAKKINDFLEKVIIPAIKKEMDVDHDKVINAVCIELGVKEDRVKECISKFIQMGKIKEIHIYTIPDEQVDGFLKEHFEKEREQKKEDEKVDKILKEVQLTKKKAKEIIKKKRPKKK